MFNFPLTKRSQQRNNPGTGKPLWKAIFSVLDPTFGCFCKISRNRDCLLKLFMLVKSARSIPCELYLEKSVYIGLSSYG